MNFTQSSTSFGDDIALDNIKDLEHDAESSRPGSHLVNDVIDNFAWKDLQVVVRDRNNGSDLSILSAAAGMVSAGEMLALMGPSGSGKTTLLNAIAHRVAAAGATTSGSILANGQQTTWKSIRDLSSYVEQEDALIGSLTVRETMIFAARLALPRYSSSSGLFLFGI
jgi:ABC-type multidrug transport system ATPase subunit